MLRATTTNEPDAELANLGDMICLLDAGGNRLESAGFDPWVADVTHDRLLSLYRDMVLVRRIDREATALQRQGELGLWAPLWGQEAAQIGSARALRDDDYIFSSYRENAVAYARGVNPEDLLRMWRGTSHSGWDPASVNMAIPAIIIGAQALHAVGYAMGIKREGTDRVAITYFGDGATSQGDVNEAMIFAASFQVPVVFFCQNNQLAISEPVTVQAKGHISDRSPGFGIPSLRVDGNDVLAVMAATRVALDRARRDGGATFIEAVTYRMGPHTTSDDPTRYRTKEEVESWAERDPISRVEKYLEAQGVLTDEVRADVTAASDVLAADLRAACHALDAPDPVTLFDNVYAEAHPELERQRDQFAAYLETIGEGDA